MDFLPAALAVIAVLALLRLLLRGPRKAAVTAPKAGVRKDEPAPSERSAARIRIVGEASRLCDLEEELTRFAEGSDAGIDDHARWRAERVRGQASRLRTQLEAECAKYGLPVGLVRRRRAASCIPTPRTLGSEDRHRTEP